MIKNIKYKEYDLVVDFCENYLYNNNIKDFQVEIPFCTNSIDLVYFINGKSYVVEFKLSDWKKGIEQLNKSKIGSDYLYLCIPKDKFNKNMYNELLKYGLGLYLFDTYTKETIEKISGVKSELVCKGGKNLLIKGYNSSFENNKYNYMKKGYTFYNVS